MPARLKLNFFTPLPPVRSNVANHSLVVVDALQRLADVIVWTDQTEPPEMTQTIQVQHFDPARVPWPLLHAADLNIYNVGNNESFHRAIFDVARQAPGLMVLHDTRLQHFFGRYAENGGADRDFYLESMHRGHGPQAVADAHAFMAGNHGFDVLVERYPMTTIAVERGIAAVIHNEGELAAIEGKTRTPIFYLPLVYAAGAAPVRSPPGATLRLIVFGFIGLNRRLGGILEALAGLPDKDVVLDIYGELEPSLAIDSLAASLGLARRVRHHGFVPDAELAAALARADLALNLRFPSMGEASGSQLYIWDAALPSLVTRTGWYASLPGDAVFFVEPDDEVATIQSHLTALRRDPERFRRAGLRGRELLLQHHAPAAYAQGLVAIAHQAKALHARWQAISLSHVVAHRLLDLADPAGIALCAEPVAEAVHALTRRPAQLKATSL
jgi:glycosyltransferase involved in cell wall biosynthesis